MCRGSIPQYFQEVLQGHRVVAYSKACQHEQYLAVEYPFKTFFYTVSFNLHNYSVS